MAPSKIANARNVYMSTTLSEAEAAKFMEWIERKEARGQMAVMIDVVLSIRSHEPLGQLLPRWAGGHCQAKCKWA
jgi:hypothetical protein